MNVILEFTFIDLNNKKYIFEIMPPLNGTFSSIIQMGDITEVISGHLVFTNEKYVFFYDRRTARKHYTKFNIFKWYKWLFSKSYHLEVKTSPEYLVESYDVLYK